MRTGSMLAAAAALLTCAAAQAVCADDPVLRKGQQEWEIGLGYAKVLDLDSNRDRVPFYTLVPRYGRFLSPRREVLLEVPLAYYYQPEKAGSIGLTLTYRQHFARVGRVLPFFELGGGGVAENLDLRDLAGDLQFQLHTGLGLRYLVGHKSSITLTGRVHHLSNGGLASPNRGLNNALVLVGYTWFRK